MLNSFHKKNIIRLAACTVVMLSLAACGNGNENVMFGVLNELGASQESAEAANTSTTAETEAAQNETSATSEPTDEAGGNPGDSFTVEITVLENKYIYDNREISYDELLEVFDNLTEADVVQFRDENAALDTYKKATSALDERNIPYINYTD